jgi:hypothetical protein
MTREAYDSKHQKKQTIRKTIGQKSPQATTGQLIATLLH